MIRHLPVLTERLPRLFQMTRVIEWLLFMVVVTWLTMRQLRQARRRMSSLMVVMIQVLSTCMAVVMRLTFLKRTWTLMRLMRLEPYSVAEMVKTNILWTVPHGMTMQVQMSMEMQTPSYMAVRFMRRLEEAMRKVLYLAQYISIPAHVLLVL